MPVPRRPYRRRTEPRAVTIALRSPKSLHGPDFLSDKEKDELEAARPRTRAECADAPRPCPFVGCRHHLFLEVTPAGSIKFNFPNVEPWELEASCALDIAERGSKTLEEVGELTNLTRERTRQIEVRGLLALRSGGKLR